MREWLTATPYRLEANRFGAQVKFLNRMAPRVFDKMIYNVQVGELQKMGFLAQMEYFRHKGIDVSQLQLNSSGSEYTDASIRAAFAVPTLPNVPRQPRGEGNSPCVLIWAGGVLPGVRAVKAVVSIASQGCVDWIVTRNVWRFVCGTASKVHAMGPVDGGGAPGSPGLT